MSRELVSVNEFNNYLETMDDSQIEMIQKKIYDMQLKKLDKALGEVYDKVSKLEEAREIDKDMHEKQLELERARHRKKENRYGYISLSDLGNQFTVAIGSKTMGTLLRLAGIAKAKQSTTEPKAESIRDDYSKSQDTPWGGIIWQWNSERCIEKIERWLKREELIDQFYSFTDERELMQYIKHLEDIYN